MAQESEFERRLIREIMKAYPGAIILKNNPNFMQGFPDRLILFEDRWAAFDAKAKKDSPHQPNQDYYIDLLDEMSLGMFVYPENARSFLNELQRTFRPIRSTRIFKR